MKMKINLQFDFKLPLDIEKNFKAKSQAYPTLESLSVWAIGLASKFKEGDYLGCMSLYNSLCSRTLGEDGADVLKETTYRQCLTSELILAIAACKYHTEELQSPLERARALGSFASLVQGYLQEIGEEEKSFKFSASSSAK